MPLIKIGEFNFMYINTGSGKNIRSRRVIGIFDMDNTSTSARTRYFLERAEKDGAVIPCDDLPKSFVLTSEYGFNRVHLTPYATATLEKRLK